VTAGDLQLEVQRSQEHALSLSISTEDAEGLGEVLILEGLVVPDFIDQCQSDKGKTLPVLRSQS
jgi:hypothetical protein